MWGWLCVAAALAASAWLASLAGLPVRAQALFVLAQAVVIVLPGLTLTTWVRRAPLFVRLSAAFVCGLPVQLLGWLVGVTTGVVAWMWVVPVATAIAVGIPTRRRLLASLRRPAPMGPAGVTVLLLAWLFVLARFGLFWVDHPARLDATNWYQDLYWHRAINASAMYRVPLEDPQAIGEFLSYHWLTNAHIGGLAAATGLDLSIVMIVAWYLPAYAALLGLAHGFAGYLTRRRWAALLAVVLVVLQPVFALNRAFAGPGYVNFAPLSPSHMLALPVTVAAVWLAAVVLKAGRTRRVLAWPPLVLVLLLLAGVKISALPVLLCGFVAVLLPALVNGRRRVRPLLLAVGTLVLTAATFPVFGGGGGGSSFQWLGSQRSSWIWRASADQLSQHGPRGDALVLYGITLILLINAAWLLPGVAAMRWRDRVGWLMLGTIASAIGVTWVLSHPGQSQLYFPMGVQPVMAVAAAAGVAWAVARNGGPRGPLLAVALAAAAAGAAAGAAPAVQGVGAAQTLWWLASLAGLAVVGLLVVRVLGARRGGAALAVAVVAFSSGWPFWSVVTGDAFKVFVPSRYRALEEGSTATAPVLTPAELQAASAAARMLPPDAVLATNVHCRGVETVPGCDARGFWVAALTERRVLLGGWAYTTLGRSTQGDEGQYHVYRPYPDADLFELNEAAFHRPSDEVFTALAQQGVTHLFAARRAGEVSPSLTRWCEPVLANADVTVCALR